MDASPQKELYEDIAQTGPGGNYLKLRSTRLVARSDEFHYPLLTDRLSAGKWAEAGKPTVYTRAREKVEEILAAPLVDPLPKGVCAGLDDILKRADKELGE